MSAEDILRTIAETLACCNAVQGVVLGGSRATGIAGRNSDVDIGVYYERGLLDYDLLNELAARLDDTHRKHLLCREGEWGPWVNCGGWLTVNGYAVDIILRDLHRVKDMVDRTDRGEFAAHYQTGHPHAYVDAAYRGELASCRILYSRSRRFTEFKQYAETYPAALKRELLKFFGFEAAFSCMLAEKSLSCGDGCYLSGMVFRAVSAMNQALFALNEQWCLNEKKAVFRIDTFLKAPRRYSCRVNEVFKSLGDNPEQSLRMLKELCEESGALYGEQLSS